MNNRFRFMPKQEKYQVIRWSICAGMLFLILAFPFGSLLAHTGEYTMKAIFLERFTRFIEWPKEAAIADTTKPFIITVLGDNPFDESLENVFSKRKILNKKVVIKYISKIDDIECPHLLFISQSMKKELPQIVQTIQGRGILSIGDTEGFAESGVLINMYLADGKIRFEINRDEAKKSKLAFSYLLMKMAKIVHGNGEQK